jgi:AAA+ superfamily predicted ATPase
LLGCFHDGPRTNPTELDMFVRPPHHLVHFLLGEQVLDEALAEGVTWGEPVAQTEAGVWLGEELYERLLGCSGSNTAVGNFAFYGGYGVGKLAMAQSIAHQRGEPLLIIDCALVREWGEMLPKLLRDAQLYRAVLYFHHWDVLLEEHQPPLALVQGLWGYGGVVIMAGTRPWQVRQVGGQKPLYEVRFPELGYEVRRQIWAYELEVQGVDTAVIPTLQLDDLANHFQFSPGQIRDAVATAQNLSRWQNEPLDQQHLLIACRAHSNQNLADLATKIKLRYTWQDIILPPDTQEQLHELINQARQRPTVHHRWGFGAKLTGKGISALFTGDPGTGKTMSADIIAGELGLDLYKVDLSSLVSKYIGETEKNLDRVFTEATTSNAVLFFDEADAIFGKRSEVKDSRDRYANLEISYLLQRMEAYDGIAILATNMRANLDEAFTRRFDFITDFPFPDAEAREEIWRIHFPPEAPVAEGLDLALLARRYPVAGGNIRKMVLAAAFLAAQAHEPINMTHLFHAARRDYQKMGRLLEDGLFG